MSNSLPESLFKAVGLNEKQWNQLLKDAPEGQDPIYWAFKNNKLSEEKYFAQAKQLYPFAHLKADILQSEVWKNFKSSLKNANLENGYIKFYSWDNVDYFLGTRPPAENFQKNTCFFFAPSSVLDDFYARSVDQTETVSSDPAVVIESVEEETKPAIETPPAESVSQDTMTQTEVPIEEAPEGIDLSGMELPDVPEDTASKESPEAVLDAPEGFSDSQVASIDNSESPDGFDLSGSESTTEEAPEGLSFDSVSEQSSSLNLDNSAEENVLSFDQATNALGDPSGDTLTEVASETPSAPPVPEAPQAENNVTEMASSKPANANSEFQNLQTQLNNVFKEAIIFSYENAEFKTVSHSDHFKPQDTSGIKTDSPSAFRIVAQTNQVYLGHLVSTEANDKFVNSWFPNAKPEKVLIQPIKVSNQLVGAFLAVCNNGLDNHSLIRKGADLAKEMTLNWPQSYSSAA